jgi:hypothetical protein
VELGSILTAQTTAVASRDGWLEAIKRSTSSARRETPMEILIKKKPPMEIVHKILPRQVL